MNTRMPVAISPTSVTASSGDRSSRVLMLLALASSAAALSGCLATAPTMGENKGTVTGAAGGGTAENKNSARF